MKPAAGSVRAALAERIDAAARGRVEPRLEAGVPVLGAPLPHPFRAAFTTRWSADDPGAAASLDLALGDPEAGEGEGSAVSRRPVGLGREVLRSALSSPAAVSAGPQLVSPLQVHGVRVAGTAEYARGRPDRPCDGLTFHPELDRGLAAVLLFADCVPVLLAGEVDAALVHGGWRGLLGGVVQQGAAAMTGPPARAFVGPSIGPCCYRVGDEVAAAFAARYGDDVVDTGPRLDLWEVAARAAGEVGVARSGVVNPRLCTSCHNDLFFSYRSEGAAAGRHGAVLWSAGP